MNDQFRRLVKLGMEFFIEIHLRDRYKIVRL